MYDLAGEEHISIPQFCRLVPSASGKPINISTAHRWIHDGINAADGTRAKLGAIRIGGRYIVSRSAVNKFIAALTGETTAEPIRTPAARNRAAEAAKKKLEAIGI